MSRGAMTMRATVSRSASQPVNSWGQPGPPVYQVIGEVACRAWSKTRRLVLTDGAEVVVEDLRAMVPASADVAERDRLVIEDRLGEVVFDGPVAVDAITSHGQRGQTRHRELMLKRHTAADQPEEVT